MSGWLGRLVVVAVLAMVVAGLPAVSSGPGLVDIASAVESVSAAVDPVEAAAAGVIDSVGLQLSGSEDEFDPSPRPVREVPDPDEVDAGPAPDWNGFDLAPGKKSADVSMVASRAVVAGTPFAVRLDDGALDRAGRVEVNVAAGQLRAAGQLSDLFTVDFVDTLGSKLVALKTPVLEVDVSSVPEGVWGDLATRLTVNWYENCTPRERVIDEDTKSTRSYVACERVVPLEKSLDLAGRVLSVELDVPPAVGVIERGLNVGGSGAGGAGGGSFWMAYAGGSSGFGIGGDLESGAWSWGATPLSNVADYQVGLYTGSFETSYPIGVPPAFVGPQPSVALGYSSGGIDGMSSATNNQAGEIGVGWSLASGGSITRHFKTCSLSPAVGDPCPIGDEYSISLNGVASRLVYKSTSGSTKEFRLEADPIWRVELIDGTDNTNVDDPGDYHGEYWVVTTPDGTRHEFGNTDDSVDWVPFYTGQGQNDPFTCPTALYDWGDADLGSHCNKAWRWNLNTTTDTSGNKVNYTYMQEFNYFGMRYGNADGRYVRASHLKEIAYNYADTSATSQAMARVLLLTEQRCLDPDVVDGCESPTDYVDTPFDTVCFAGCTDYAPSFFTQRKLASILTQVYDTTGAWDTVAWYDLDQTFPDPTQSGEAASERRLWLNKVRQRPGGDSVSWPAFVELEAEDFDGSNGLPSDPFADTEDTGGGLHVKSLGDEDWFMFENVDFGDGAASVLLRYATMNTGGKVEFRAGSATADPFAVFDVNDTTGDWQTFETAEVNIAANDTPTGVTDLYVRMERGTGNNLVAYINWIRFTKSGSLDHLAPIDYDRVDLKNRIYGTLPIRVARIDHIDLPLGGQVDVTYGQTHEWDESLPASNPCSAAYTGGNVRRRCDFYVAYDPDYSGGDWVHWNKYKVLELATSDPNSENADTHLEYGYPEAPEWHYSNVPGYNNHTGYSSLTCSEMPCNHWNDYRGHAVVRVTETNGGATEYSTTEHRFYQGMDGDHNGSASAHTQDITLADGTTTYTDHEWLAGRSAQVITSDSRTNPWANFLTHTETRYDKRETVAGAGAYFVWTDRVDTTTEATGTDLVTRVDYTYENEISGTFYGRLSTVIDRGQTAPAISGDNRTTEYQYTTANTTDWIIQAVKVQNLWSGTAPGTSTNELAHSKFYYDGHTSLTAAPTDGLLTKTLAFKERSPSNLAITTSSTYDSYGRVATATDGKGTVTKFEYDADYGYPNKVTADEGTGKLNHVTTTEMDPGFGVPTLTRDPHANVQTPTLGQPTTYEYDEYGRLVEVYSPTETGTDPTVEFIYTLDGTLPIGHNAKVETKTLTDSSTTPSTYTSKVDYYDGFGRLIQTQTQAPTSGQRYISARFYNDRGLIRDESTRWLNTSGNPGAGAAYAGWVDPDWTGANMDMDLASIHDYDDYGRATKIATRSKGNSGSDIWDTQYAYDGWKTTITDRNGNASTTNTLDARGNLTVVTQNDGATTTTTNYSYDLADRLDTVTHPDATTETSITYDLLGRKLSLDDPDMGQWAYTYDNNGNLATQTDAVGNELTFTYDNLNRPETKKNGSTTLATWTYDTARVGFLDEAVAYQDNYTITVDNTSYDDRGQLLSTTTSIKEGTNPADSYTVDRTYLESGNTHTLKYPGSSSREEVTYTYNERTNQPETLTSGTDPNDVAIVSAASWTIHGQPDAQTWDSGTYAMAIDWIYDTDTLRLSELRAGIDGTMNVQRLKYTYDDNSNIETIRDYRNSSQYQCFTYDNLNRLKEAETSDDCTSPTSSPGDGDFDHSYTYDNLGNIKPAGAGYTYGTGTAGPHAPTAANGWTYTYDNNGNQHTRTHPSPSSQIDTLTFDVNNRLVNYQSDTGGASEADTEFIYDAAGNRAAVIDDTGVATHYIAGIYQITGSAEENTYTFGGRIVGINKGGTRHHVVTDHLGSITATIEYGLSATETNIERLRYEPYGNKRTIEATAGDRTYTGQIDDTASTGLMYYNARYYDPNLRTFISADSIVPNVADSLDLNRYSYVRNNPLAFSDPTGHETCDLETGVCWNDIEDSRVGSPQQLCRCDDPVVIAMIMVLANLDQFDTATHGPSSKPDENVSRSDFRTVAGSDDFIRELQWAAGVLLDSGDWRFFKSKEPWTRQLVELGKDVGVGIVAAAIATGACSSGVGCLVLVGSLVGSGTNIGAEFVLDCGYEGCDNSLQTLVTNGLEGAVIGGFQAPIRSALGRAIGKKSAGTLTVIAAEGVPGGLNILTLQFRKQAVQFLLVNGVRWSGEGDPFLYVDKRINEGFNGSG